MITQNTQPEPNDGERQTIDCQAGDRLSIQMRTLLELADGKDMSLGDLLDSFTRGSHAIMMVFLSFPLCFPMGIPVLTSSIGLLLAFVGLSFVLGRHLWIPRRLRAKKIPYQRLVQTVERLLRITNRMERWFHPRFSLLATSGLAARIHGAFVLFVGLIEIIPLPFPFHNMVAAVPVLLLGLSLLERDGVLVIASYLATIPAVIYYGAIILLGREGISHLIGA